MSPAIAPFEERRLFGIGLALVAYFMFTGIDSSAKWLGLAGLPALQVVFIRYAVHLGLVAVIHLPRQRMALFRTSSLKLQALRAGALLAATSCNFIAVRYLPLTVTGSIAFTMPLILCALSVPLLGEQVGWRRWSAILVGFLGVIVIVRPGTDAFHPAALLSLLAALASAFYFLITRMMAGSDTSAAQQFYIGIFATIALLPFALIDWVWPSDPAAWVAFFAIGAFGFVGHQFVAEAHRHAPASLIAPFSYTQIIFMAGASWIVFNEPPDVWLYVGAPIVVGSGLYIWLRERKLARQTIPREAPPT
jgi:drug/metabolite transporter (DMT)-like permease